jgi:hypothetical protein
MDYYKTIFRQDLVIYFKGKSDIEIFGSAILEDAPDAYRQFRCEFYLDGLDWQSERKLEFCFSLYFTVLTDMALHAYFPSKHKIFDRVAMYPKLFGLGVRQRMLPSSVLYYASFYKSDFTVIQRLWCTYCNYFISDWQYSLPLICGVDGLDFLHKLLIDPDLLHNYKSEKERSYSRDRQYYLESVFLDLMKTYLNGLN